MKIIKIKVIIVVSLILFVFAIVILISLKPGSNLSETEFAHLFSFFIDLNSFEINIDQKISQKDVEIIWSTYDKKTTIYNGEYSYKSNFDVRYRYGTNIFKIYYKDKLIKKFYQHKFNNWHYHKYIFSINNINSKIKIDLKVIGPDQWIQSSNN